MPSCFQSTHSILLKATPEKVYEALTDWAVRSQWRKGIEMSWEGDSKAFVSQQVTFKVKSGPFKYFFSYRITGLEPPHRVYMEYTGIPLKGRAAMEITTEEGGSRVAFHWMKVEPGDWRAKLYFALGLGMRSHRVRTLETLRMLKEYLEGKA